MAVRLLRIDAPNEAETGSDQPAAPTGRERIGRKLRRRLGFSLLESPFRQPGHTWLDDIEVTEKLRELAARPPAGRRGRSLVLLEADL
ncbi:hypothetical protein CFN78_10815 [Amycolatopsis antarctica]|uniref:Uncharacterized protein n=1 Tax=Amycolatopsis antarctica TaxID=1854586 RepID=A0A263D4C0_9PSEU|nr:hypothetical protein [Amycolatopsis antarctica]OZM73332.1 hypothetical protein CFN78_10815 [Amycolatopsis antarctica]